jgi:RNA polymerase sigma-70 factor (ECF subfamily)
LSAEDDATRFTRLYGECYDHVLAYALRRVQDDAARDVAAETFLVAWRRLEEVPAEPLPWLYGVARNIVGNEYRRTQRTDRLYEKIAGQRTGHSLDAADQVVDTRALAAALAALSPADRELLQLIAWEGLSPADAAAALGCRPATVLVRLHRARRRLKHALRSSAAPMTVS